jgi:IS5 family transposase
MNRVVPWMELCDLIEPHYPKAGRGRRPVGLERMLRLHFLQHWYNLSDPGLEEELLESESMRKFVGIDLGVERVPDETTVCKFRHLLERHGLGRRSSRAWASTCRRGASGSAPAPSWTPRSSARRPPPRTSIASATRRWERPRRAGSGCTA